MVPRDKFIEVLVLLCWHDPEHSIGIKPMTHYRDYFEVYTKEPEKMNAYFYNDLARMICNAVIEGGGGKNLHLDEVKRNVLESFYWGVMG